MRNVWVNLSRSQVNINMSSDWQTQFAGIEKFTVQVIKHINIELKKTSNSYSTESNYEKESMFGHMLVIAVHRFLFN